jgi:HPt (histidine-containing phosphotransfer) domain-containing protein
MINEEKNNTALDLSYLRDMSGNSIEFMIEMIDMFKQQTPLYISELEQALANKDWPKVSSCAHKIKPTFSYVGREDAKNHMQMIEHNARELNDLESLPKAFQELTDFIQVLNKQLDSTKLELEKQL